MGEFEDQVALQGVLSSRPESPALEDAASKAMGEAFRTLIEAKYLYQKVTVDLSGMDAAITAAVQEASERAAIAAATPGICGGRAQGYRPIPVSPKRLEALHEEVEKRPWRLVTHHMGDTPEASRIHGTARIGHHSYGKRPEEMSIGFYLPAVHLFCPGSCKRGTTFIALVSSSDYRYGSPFPREIGVGTEQIFIPLYRCEMCRQTIYTILVRRTGLRLHLCGFAPRREPLTTKPVPDPFVKILSDAEQAVAEGDTFAAFYHLRTMLEHYLKARLGIPIEEAIRGDELVARHNATLPSGLSGFLPSFATAYENLSKWLHSRTGDAQDYQSQRDAICKHIEVLTALDGGESP